MADTITGRCWRKVFSFTGHNKQFRLRLVTIIEVGRRCERWRFIYRRYEELECGIGLPSLRLANVKSGTSGTEDEIVLYNVTSGAHL